MPAPFETMTQRRPLPRPRSAPAALFAALMLAAPLAPVVAAQDQTAEAPAPAPAPASTPAASAPVEMVSTPVIQPLPSPRPSAPTARPAARVAAPAPIPAPSPSAQASLAPTLPDATPTGTATSGAPLTLPPLDPPAAPAAELPSSALGAPAFDWRWLVAGGLLIASMIGALLLWRRRPPKVPRLAAPPALASDTDDAAEPPRIAISLDIPGASRSVMMFTLRYRLTLENRSDRAVNRLSVAVQLSSARRGASNAAPLAAAQALVPVDRIGPHQSRIISGEVQMPLAEITPVMQGQTPLFIPLLHVTIEGEGQSALARSFVIGPPGQGAGRLQPLLLAAPPGSLPDMLARMIDPPPASQ